MNREIKFRGWSVEGGEWVYGSLVNNLWVVDKTKQSVCEIIVMPDNGDCWEDVISAGVIEVIPESVGQFTGLRDSKGTEIYEGIFFAKMMD